MLYFIGVLSIWFVVRLYSRTLIVDHASQPYELNRIYLEPIGTDDENNGFAVIRPEEEWSIDEDEVRRVLKASKELSRHVLS